MDETGASLVIHSPAAGEERHLELGQQSIVVGRAEDCDVVLVDRLASRRHFRIEPTQEGWVLSDLDSTTGTAVNGRNVRRHRLTSGDIIQAAQTRVEYRAPEVRSGGTLPSGAASPSPDRTPAPASSPSFFDPSLEQPSPQPSSKSFYDPSLDAAASPPGAADGAGEWSMGGPEAPSSSGWSLQGPPKSSAPSFIDPSLSAPAPSATPKSAAPKVDPSSGEPTPPARPAGADGWAWDEVGPTPSAPTRRLRRGRLWMGALMVAAGGALIGYAFSLGFDVQALWEGVVG